MGMNLDCRAERSRFTSAICSLKYLTAMRSLLLKYGWQAKAGTKLWVPVFSQYSMEGKLKYSRPCFSRKHRLILTPSALTIRPG